MVYFNGPRLFRGRGLVIPNYDSLFSSNTPHIIVTIIIATKEVSSHMQINYAYNTSMTGYAEYLMIKMYCKGNDTHVITSKSSGM